MNKSRRQFLAWLGGFTLVPLFTGIAKAKSAVTDSVLGQKAKLLLVKGKVFLRGEADYEKQRRFSVWQALMPERFPDMIVQATSEADIVNTIEFARAQKIPVAVKGGGGSFVASHVRKTGIMLDVSALGDIKIDTSAMMAYVGPGIRSGEFAHLLGLQGLAFPVPHGVMVALGGYLLGGGMGWNNESWNNFSCFNVEAMEMILANGEKIIANRESHADLFWAARGGGPTFCAVVTRFHLRVFPLPKAITTCTYIYPIDETDSLSRWLENIRPQHQQKVELSLILQKDKKTPAGEGAAEPYCVLSAVCFANDKEEAGSLLGRILHNAPTQGRVTVNEHRAMNFGDLLELSRILIPQRMANDTAWVNDPGSAMRRLGEHIRHAPEDSEIALILNFRANTDLPDDAAYSVVAPLFINLAAMWENPGGDDENQQWMDNAIDKIDDITVGSYINESDFFRRPQRSRLYMTAANWKRLAQVYGRYDPQGVFPPPLELPG